MNFVSAMTKNYYHICSDGNYASVLFYDTVDYKAAMNRIAVLSLRMEITILAFVLMDNHFHFVVACDSDEKCVQFITEFKRLTGKFISDIHHEPASLRGLPVQVIPLKDEDTLRTVIAYVVKNPTKARISMFYNYPWGTGGLYFNPGSVQPASSMANRQLVSVEHTRQHKRQQGRPSNPGGDPTPVSHKSKSHPERVQTADALGTFAVRNLCHTRVKIPGNWIIADGVILPINYVDVGAVESFYKTTRSYMYSLSLNKDDEIEKDMEEWGGLLMSDIELRAERNAMMRRLFAIDSIRSLSLPQRLKLARELRWKYKCSKKQLARIVHLPYETVSREL